MEGMIKAMNADEKVGVVLFYASQTVPARPVSDARLAQRGREIFGGNCFRCHGNDAHGNAQFARLAGQFIRRLIKKKGYQDQPAPVTVAKRDEAPAAGQISFEDFEAEVSRLVNGEGPWDEVEAFVNVRADLYEEARNEEAAIRARQASAESKLSTLGL
jgi:mono/diheme cytochrome c family protein